jgi:DNA-binding response OmpR family regulator
MSQQSLRADSAAARAMTADLSKLGPVQRAMLERLAERRRIVTAEQLAALVTTGTRDRGKHAVYERISRLKRHLPEGWTIERRIGYVLVRPDEPLT